MRSIFVVLSLICCLNPWLTWAADNKPLENTEFQVFKAQTELKFETIRDIQQKAVVEIPTKISQAIDVQGKTIDAFDKRIADLNLYIALASIIITVLAIFATFVGYSAAASKAKNIAEDWFKNNENGLLARLKVLEVDLAEKATQAHNAIDVAKQSVIDKGVEVTKNMSITNKTGSAEVSAEDKITLLAADQALKDKPESQYTFSDWNTRAFATNSKNNFALAADFWDKAAQTQGATSEEVVMALCNRGLNLKVLNQPEQAVATFDDIINRYGDSKKPILQALVSIAVGSKGSTLLMLAKLAWQDTVERQSLLNKALVLLSNAVAKSHIFVEQHTGILGTIAYTLWLLGLKEEAKTPLREALQRGGEAVRDGWLDAAAINTVDADAGFVALVNKLWDEHLARESVKK
jgi:tetratricopeptide (TPR) repeat protein